MAYDSGFTGGVRVAASDADGDGLADIITGAGTGGGPHVRVFDADSQGEVPEEIRGYFAFDSSFTGGVFTAGSTNSESNVALLRLAEGLLPRAMPRTSPWQKQRRFLNAALDRLPFANGSTETIQDLAALNLSVADLDGEELAEARPGEIVLDINAAGLGWYIDPTPFDDEEFAIRDPGSIRSIPQARSIS